MIVSLPLFETVQLAAKANGPDISDLLMVGDVLASFILTRLFASSMGVMLLLVNLLSTIRLLRISL